MTSFFSRILSHLPRTQLSFRQPVFTSFPSILTHLSSPFPSLFSPSSTPVRHATKKAGGTIKNKKDTAGRRLGVKLTGGAIAKPGAILVRQRGTTVHPGRNVHMGRDHTLMSMVHGRVAFTYLYRDYRKHKRVKYIHVLSVGDTLQDVRDETATKAAVNHAFFTLRNNKNYEHIKRQPSPTRMYHLAKSADAHHEKIAAENAKLSELLQQNNDEAKKLLAHPLFKLREAKQQNIKNKTQTQKSNTPNTP